MSERTVSDAIRALLTDIWLKEGICVRHIYVDWMDTSTMDQPQMQISDIDIEFSTKGTRVKVHGRGDE